MMDLKLLKSALIYLFPIAFVILGLLVIDEKPEEKEEIDAVLAALAGSRDE